MRKYKASCKEEEEFLKNYDPDRYEKAANTADIVIFTMSDKNELSVLLIKRGGYPYKGHWAIPGGFMQMDEDIDITAARELKEETKLDGIHIEQFKTFGAVDRDPRMRVISIAYMAFVPQSTLDFEAGDDASDAELFKIKMADEGFDLIGDRDRLSSLELAFDHEEIISTAIERLKNRIDYTMDAFEFLKDKKSFTIYELKKIYEAVKGESIDASNFRRDFLRKYVKTGLVDEIGTSRQYSKRAAAVYKLL